MMKTLVLLVVLTICIPSVSFAGIRDQDFLGGVLSGAIKNVSIVAQRTTESYHIFTIVRKISPISENEKPYRIYSCIVHKKGITECWHSGERMTKNLIEMIQIGDY